MVAITFRSDDGGRWGTGYGANLSAAQIDINFWNMKVAVEALETALPDAARSIDSFVVSGNTFTIEMSDATTEGPFDLPTIPWTFVGSWAASTSYSVGDVFSYGTAVYSTREAHTSDTTFDPNATNGGGDDLYSLMFDLAVSNEPKTVTGTTYTLLAEDAGKFLRFTNAAGCEVDIPVSATLLAATGSNWTFKQAAAGPVTFVAPTGVTIHTLDGHDLATATEGETCRLYMFDDDEFDLYGFDGGAGSALIPAGGSTGEVLAKASGSDFDTEWVAAGGGGGSAPLYRCMATLTAAITGTSGFTTIPWDSEAYDTGTIHNNSTDSDRLTTPTGATLVRVGCTVYFQSVAANAYVNATIRRSAGSFDDSKQMPSGKSAVATGDNNSIICLSSGPIVVAGANEYFDVYYEADDPSFTIGQMSNFWLEVLA